ncbi:hypothetical protein [Pelagicoccus sp. SDUM812002]|uniref:hypothetical protein n=1 Tax=Pelagicoccus sp. SDUM812002 TaxID=3041266 RepID=UPI00280D80A0|nr:hypothetical protein [Pelagicoccus sp. SDUM812002]MDQ8186355.1 hypothetical protein [Pelagicoccus sp. SDUM812002]
MKTKLLFGLLVSCFAVLFSGCETSSVGLSEYENEPPSKAFSSFENFELAQVTLAKPFDEKEVNKRALEKLQAELDVKLAPLVSEWNASADERPDAGGTLLVEPVVREIKFVSGSTRFWGGAMAGDSAIVVEVKYLDKATGELISKARFYQHANAMGGGWSVGGTDKAMLARVGTLVMEFTERNFEQAVGGPTGKPSPRN